MNLDSHFGDSTHIVILGPSRTCTLHQVYWDYCVAVHGCCNRLGNLGHGHDGVFCLK